MAGRSWGGCQHHHVPFQAGQANGGSKATKWPVMLIKRAFNRASPGSPVAMHKSEKVYTADHLLGSISVAPMYSSGGVQ